MKIENLSQFKALVKVCRSLGIEAMKVDNMEFSLGKDPKPKKQSMISNKEVSDMFPEANLSIPLYNAPTETAPKGEVPSADKDLIKTDDLTPEQLLMYSVASEVE